MQFLIVSDIHANWHALEAVLADCAGEYQEIVCCGDVVGYNPQPARVLEWTKANCSAVVRGNHDKVVAGLDDIEWFNGAAQTAARWTAKVLAAGQIQYLADLPLGPILKDEFAIWHGSPMDEDEYLMELSEAAPRFSNMPAPLGFFGHTHLQGGFYSKYGRVGAIHQVPRNESEYVLELEPDVMYMINPGSVGQPRDRDPRAAYVLYDPGVRQICFRRVPYPVRQTIEEIGRAGLPEALGLRLLAGF